MILSFNVLDLKVKHRQEMIPFYMPLLDFLLSKEILQTLMISLNSKLIANQKMFPDLHYVDPCYKLLLIDVKLQFCRCQHATIKGNKVYILR